jgi:hypothetical protein
MNIAYTRSELFDLNAARSVIAHWWIALFTGFLTVLTSKLVKAGLLESLR